MESSDLLEISGGEDDDSLLLPIPIPTTTTTTGNIFTCSPLQFPISKHLPPRRVSLIRGLKDSVDFVKSSCSPPRGSRDKENIHTAKSEVQKLSVDPLKMKRKKKGGGYNLRKSLAWDRAFFTEEGVLNPIELSLLSGTLDNSCGEALSVINEEGENSSFDDSNSSANSAYMQAVEENLFKEIPTTALNKMRVKGGCLPPKHDSSAQHSVSPIPVIKKKALPSHGVRRTGFGSSDCPRPVASSSLKRPATLNTTQAARKESKLPKIPVLKTAPCPLNSTTKSSILSASHFKHNQIAHAVTDVQKNVGLKSTPKTVKCTQNKPKSCSDSPSLPAKSSDQHSRQNLSNCSLGMHSSTIPRPPLAGKSNRSSNATTGRASTSTGVHSSDRQGGHKFVAVQLLPNNHSIGGSTHYGPIQTMKASSLRMPSPSLGYFDQSKASVSTSLSPRNTEASNNSESTVPGLLKSSKLRPPLAPGKTSKMVNDSIASVKSGALCLRSGYSAPSTLSSVSHERKKTDLELKHVQNVEAKVPDDSRSSEPTSNTHEVHNEVDEKIHEHGKYNKTMKISCKENIESQINDNELLLKSGFCDKLREDYNQKDVTIVCPECKVSSDDDLGNPQYMWQNDCGMHIIGGSGTQGTIEHQHEEDKLHSSSSHCVISKLQIEDAISCGEQTSSTMHSDCVGSVQHYAWPSSQQAELVNSFIVELDQGSQWENCCLKTMDRNSMPFIKSEINETRNSRDVNFTASECGGNDWDNAYLSSQPEYTEQDNEVATGVVNLSNILPLEDAKLHVPNEILFVESYNSNTSTLAVAQHSPYLEDGKLSEQSGNQLELQNHCFSVEQNLHYNPGLCSDESMLFVESTCPEAIPRTEIIEATLCFVPRESVDWTSKSNGSEVVNHVAGTTQGDGMDKDQLTEEAPIQEAILDHGMTASAVENQECVTDSHSRHDVQPYGKVTPSEFDVFFSKELGFLQRDQTLSYGSTVQNIGIDGFNNDVLLVKEAETKIPLNDSYLMSHRTETNNNGSAFVESRAFEESQKYQLEDIPDSIPKAQGHTEAEFGSCQTTSHLKIAEDVTADSCLDNLINRTHLANAEVQPVDGTLSPSAVHDRCLAIVPCNKQSEEQPELPDCGLVAEHNFLGNHGLPLKDLVLTQEGTNLAAALEETFLESVADVGKQKDDRGIELKSSNIVAQCLAMQDGSVDVDKMADHPQPEDAPSGSVGIDTSVDLNPNGQVISLEFDSASNTRKDQTTGVINTSIEYFLNKKLDLLNQGDKILSRSSHVAIDINRKDKDQLWEQPPLEALVDSRKIASSVENHECFIDSHCRHDVQLDGVVTTLEFDAFLNKELGSLLQSAQTSPHGSPVPDMRIDGLNSDAFVKETETKILLKDSSLTSQRADTNDGSVLEESKAFEESWKDHLEIENIADSNPKLQCHTDSEFESSLNLSDLNIAEDITEGPGLDNVISRSHMRDAEVQSLNATLSASAVREQCLKTVDCNNQFEEQPVWPDSGHVTEHNFLGNHGLPTKNLVLFQEGTNFEVTLAENVLESDADVVKQNDDYGIQSKSFNVVAQVLAMQDGGVDVDKMDDHPQPVDAQSGSVAIKTSVDMDLNDEAMSSQFDSALKTRKDQITGVINTSTENSLNEQLDLPNQGDWTLSRSSQVTIEVGPKKNFLPVETELYGHSKSSVDELHHELDNANCLTRDKEDGVSLKKPENDVKRDKLINPPPNAVPFSDEWLEAIEAAGEDILTMKGGAVQNSPPDKSLPEPSPWSPVKRKNNDIGPFDCTKFTNLLPSDSH